MAVALRHAGHPRSIRESYWILRGREVVKKVVNQYPKCWKQSCPLVSEQVALLPTDEVTPVNPFDVVEVDFTGALKYGRGV
ncbi:hypothetical protein HPB48_013221 [Haemaphysalis longicornis]|uniref:Uncharacterized protein n=1 Tax=Haemaphysalis longicornis TaxID=44386 RepID=A0A9J6GYT7_HAELO|nr:hypothetical protein HPB48_013221 [Haemaphysalis longicornis]